MHELEFFDMLSIMDDIANSQVNTEDNYRDNYKVGDNDKVIEVDYEIIE